MTEKLQYWEVLMRVLSNGEYSIKDKNELYLDVQRFCVDNFQIVPPFEFRKRGKVLTSIDVDTALRHLMDGKRIVTEEHSGLIKVIK